MKTLEGNKYSFRFLHKGFSLIIVQGSHYIVTDEHETTKNRFIYVYMYGIWQTPSSRATYRNIIRKIQFNMVLNLRWTYHWSSGENVNERDK